MADGVSVLTIAAGRAEHLANLVRGLDRQTRPPAELVIAVMQPEPYRDLPQTGFPVRQVGLRSDGALNLSKARNVAADAASADSLAFVDVDCIPAPDFVADLAATVKAGRGLVMGEVGYLPAGALDRGIDYTRFERVAVRHPDRRGPPERGLDRCGDYRCFWSLNFAMHRADWIRSGGFDERYRGYGGEDTDFGRTLTARDIDMWWMKGAAVYHQFHEQLMPPVHQVASVLRNAELFASKWGHRTMEHWLRGFRLMGLIEPAETGLKMVRSPDADDLALCRPAPDMPFAHTRSVLDRLEAMERSGVAPSDAGRSAPPSRLIETGAE